MKAMFQRELHALMHSAAGWLLLAAVPMAFAVMTTMHLISGSAADYIRVVLDSTVVFALILPMLAARGTSADRRSGADRLLRSLPLCPAKIVAGRYLAWCVPFLIGTAVSCLYPAALSLFAMISLSQVFSGMLSFALCGMMIIALALYVSRLSANVLVNVLVSAVLLVLGYYLPNIVSWIVAAGAAYWTALVLIALTGLFFGWKATRSLTSALVCAVAAEVIGILLINGSHSSAGLVWNSVADLMNYQSHFSSLSIGVLELGDLVYFVLTALFLLALSVLGQFMDTITGRRSAR